MGDEAYDKSDRKFSNNCKRHVIPCLTGSKRFQRSLDPKRHEGIHAGKKLLACSRYDESLEWTGDLKRYEMTHTDEKPLERSRPATGEIQDLHLVCKDVTDAEMPMDKEDYSVGKEKDNYKGANPPLRGKSVQKRHSGNGRKRRSVIINTRSFLGAKSYFYSPTHFPTYAILTIIL